LAAAAVCLGGAWLGALAYDRLSLGLGPARVRVSTSVPDDGYKPPEVGDPAPDFVLRDPEGRPYHLRDHIGRLPIVLEFGSFT
jgi:hypothetical protein